MEQPSSPNSDNSEEDRNTLISLCVEAKIEELKEKLALPQFKQILFAPLKFGNFQNETLLHYVCAYAFEEVEVVQVILENGGDEYINSGNIPPLAYAAQRNHKGLVSLLLKHGANPAPAILYAVNPEVSQLLRKKQQEIRKGQNEKLKGKAKNQVTTAPTDKQQVLQNNRLTVTISKHIALLFPQSEGLSASDIEQIATKFSRATSFSDVANGFQLLCERCQPEGDKATGEFVVGMLLLPWGLPTFARHVAVDHHGQAILVAEALFSRLPAYKVAVFVENRLSNFEKERPRSAFPHLYITLVHAIADTIITSLVGNTHPTTTSTEDMVAATIKLVKWLSAVGFITIGSTSEPSSVLKNRLLVKSLSFTSRYLCAPKSTPEGSPSIIVPETSLSPPYPPLFTQARESTPFVMSPTQHSPELSAISRSTSPPADRDDKTTDETATFFPNIPDDSEQPSPDTSSPSSLISSSSTSTVSPVTSPTSSPPIPTRTSPTTSPTNSPRPHARSTSPTPSFENLPSSTRSTTSPPRTSSSRPTYSTTATRASTPPPRSMYTTGPLVSASTPVTAFLPAFSPPPVIPTTQPTAYQITVQVDHPQTGGFTVKMYNTTALAVLHDKISARLRSRLAMPTFGNGLIPKDDAQQPGIVDENWFVLRSGADGRRIEMNEPGLLGELAHPNNVITIRILNSN